MRELYCLFKLVNSRPDHFSADLEGRFFGLAQRQGLRPQNPLPANNVRQGQGNIRHTNDIG